MFFITLLSLITAAACVPLHKRTSFSAKDLLDLDSSTLSCAGAEFPDECRTASQAAPAISQAFAAFGINDFLTQASLVSTILYETGGLKYSSNHFPGIAGQGTRNMQSPAYNLKYAQYLATLPDSGITSQDVKTAQAAGPSAVLALVNTDKWSFASAAWYLTTQCGSSVRQGLSEGTQAGWSSYLTCVGTTATNDRTSIWDHATGLSHWST